MMCKKILTFLICIAVPLAVGGISGWSTMDAMKNFQDVAKPPLYPPGWLFPVVWTLLFIAMGIASYLVITADYNKTDKKSALTIYVAQLFVNFCWPIFFFNFGLYGFSFIWLLFLMILVFITMINFGAIKKSAGYLFVPYFIWLIFAGYLNFSIWMLN